MRRTYSAIPILLLVFSGGCGHSADLSRANTQLDFGVKAAKINLWREARFRFERAIQIDPGNAQAHNNLAVAYEGTGDFEHAKIEYLKALQLAQGDAYVQKNYSRFTEFYTRSKKPAVPPAATAAPTPMPAATTPAQAPATAPATGTTPPAAPPSQPPPAKPPGGGGR